MEAGFFLGRGNHPSAESNALSRCRDGSFLWGARNLRQT